MTNQPRTRRRRKRGKLNSSTDTQQPFRLLDLPIELRILVYESAFAGDYPIAKAFKMGCIVPALLFVNKQVHLEAMPIFYRETIFRIDWEPQAFARRLSRLPSKYHSALRCIRIAPFADSTCEAIERIQQYKAAVAREGVKLRAGVFWVLVFEDGRVDRIKRINELGVRE